MKAKRLGKPDYASVVDARVPGRKAPTFGENLDSDGRYVNTIQPYEVKKITPQGLVANAKASASAALTRMGHQPLPSKRAPKGNNPGSVAQIKVPRTTRSK